MREINALVDLELVAATEPERSAGEIAEPIDRDAGSFVESGNKKGRGQMREVMLDVMHFRFDSSSELRPKLAVVARLEGFLNRRGGTDVFDFLRHQFRMRPMSQNETEPT